MHIKNCSRHNTPVLPKSPKHVWEEEADGDHQHASLEHQAKPGLVELWLVNALLGGWLTLHLTCDLKLLGIEVSTGKDIGCGNCITGWRKEKYKNKGQLRRSRKEKIWWLHLTHHQKNNMKEIKGNIHIKKCNFL